MRAALRDKRGLVPLVPPSQLCNARQRECGNVAAARHGPLGRSCGPLPSPGGGRCARPPGFARRKEWVGLPRHVGE